MTNLQFRVLIAAIYFPLMLVGAYQAGLFATLICIVLAGCWYELLRFNREWNDVRDIVRDVSAIVVGCLPPLVFSFNQPLSFGYVFALLILEIYIIYSITQEKRFSEMMETVGRYMLGFIYLTVPLTMLIQLRNISAVPKSEAVIWFLLFVVAASDTAAYYVGRQWGRKPFFERISPKKTVEGFVGGVIGAAIVGAVFAWIFQSMEGGEYQVPNPWIAGLLAAVIAVVAAFGDLFESQIKRHYGVKDSGRALGGHGGFLDRFDSLIFAGIPLFFYIVIRGGFR